MKEKIYSMEILIKDAKKAEKSVPVDKREEVRRLEKQVVKLEEEVTQL